jgi:hypothetical protein
MRLRTRPLLVAALVTSAVGWMPEAGAEPPSPCGSIADWNVVRGSVRALPACGAYLALTDADSGVFSYVDLLYGKPMRAPLDMEVTWRRLGPETGRALELRVLGAMLLLRDGEYGLYTWNEATFEFRPLPGYREHDEHRVSVHQTATTVTFSLDGRVIDSWPLVSTGEGPVGVAAKGATGYRSAFVFHDFHARSQ